MIPTGLRYTARLKGSVLKLVPCEGCGAEYVYSLERTATGQGSSPLFLDNAGAKERATREAEAALRSELLRGVDVVPCPACGRVQRNMIPLVRRRRHRWMLLLGICLLAASIPILLFSALLNAPFAAGGRPSIPWLIFVPTFGGPAFVGVALIVAKFVLAGRYDPNLEAEEVRVKQGRERALLRTEWERMRQGK